jgi:septal ring factor EnvC (AmiA/AmiB activator)
MVRLVRYLIYFSFCITTFNLLAQSDSELNTKQNELKTLKNEISRLEKEISSQSKKEKETFNLLQNYDKQSYLLNKIISRYRAEENLKIKQITVTELKINALSKEISRFQTNYAKYVNSIYRKGKQSDLAVIFDSESIANALRRLFYLKKFSERRQKDLIKFEHSKNELSIAKIKLEKEKAEESILMERKIAEEKVLNRKTNERKKILTAIKKDKTQLRKELDTKKKAEDLIKNIIVRLNAEKVKRENELNDKNERVERKSTKEKIAPKKFASFEGLKGNMIWPVDGGKIIRKYGENKNLILNTITLNYGVDIKVSSNLNVNAVANGIISAIDWIPGYGSIMIITHQDDYRTVYSHLSEIYVQEGEQVNTDQIIATIGESIEGYVLHFEIWNSRVNQNPEVWLVKK